MYNELTVDSGGVDLYCRHYGKGAPLLLMHGACVDCDFWSGTAEYLSKSFMVITYDRRGYSRSTKPVDNDYTIEAQANDAARIIQYVGKPVHVIAHSGGAIIALNLISRFPDFILKTILYEPPVSKCLTENSDYLEALHKISNMITEGKYTSALNQFWALIGNKDERARSSMPEEMENLIENSKVFIRNEFDNTFYYQPEYELIRKTLIYIAVGDLSSKSYTRTIATNLSEKLSGELVYYPGMHNCAFDLPASFAYMSAGILLLNPGDDQL